MYEGVHLYTSRRVAVKVLNPEYANHEEARLRLLDEARALGMVRHPNVVEIHDAGTWENAPYLITELLEGRNLEGLLTTRGRIHPTDALQVVRQVALGLAAAHRVGVVHRDVKPANVVIVRGGDGREKATLIDFGVAKLPRGADKISKRFGDSGGAVGTPEYMAPEQLRGATDVDGRADLYALGVVLWECFTETVPVPGELGAVMAWHATHDAPSLRRVRPDLAPAVLELVDRCLAKDPRDRFADAQSLVHAIDATGLCRGNMHLVDYGMSMTQEMPAITAAQTDAARAVGQRPQLTANDLAWKRIRSAQRAPFTGPVRAICEHETADLRGEDIAEQGMLAVGPAGFVAGERVVLRFALPTTGDVVNAPAIVRWVRAREGSSMRAAAAVGFEFVDAPPALRHALSAYIAILAASQNA